MFLGDNIILSDLNTDKLNYGSVGHLFQGRLQINDHIRGSKQEPFG